LAPRLLSVAVTGGNPDDYDDEQSEPSPTPWHNRTPAVVGASVLGLAAIAILVLAVSYVARHFSDSPEAPLYYVEPSFSATATPTSSPTTTQTITSTSPPVTSDINPSTTSPTSSSDTSSSETSTPRTRASEDEGGEESTPRTTRRPRTNVTRTLYPLP
jgi:hypothetical protein